MQGASPSVDELCPATTLDRRWDEAAQLRGVLLDPERLALHAADVSRTQGEPLRGRGHGPLAAKVARLKRALGDAYGRLASTAHQEHVTLPAEEWLLDNAHAVEEQLREVEEDLPSAYLAELPRIGRGIMAGHPRVYALCLDYLRHADARVEPDSLVSYVNGAQTASALSIGELWAAPIMLRLGLLHIVLDVAGSVLEEQDRVQAAAWADALAAPDANAAPLLRELDEKKLSPSFLVELQRLLREHDAPPEPFDWLRARAAAMGESPEDLARRVHLKRAADQLSIANAITSMRTIGTYDWSTFFERTSVVEEMLRRDPQQVYAKTDATCRDRYRHAVEDVARRSLMGERDVAATALSMAESAASGPRRCVGFYLENDGLRELERLCQARLGPRRLAARAVVEHPRAFYFSLIAAATIGLVLAAFSALRDLGQGPAMAAAVAALLAIGASEIAASLVGTAVMALLPPRLLSRYAFEQGISADHRTLVVVPVLFEDADSIDKVVNDLEIRALGNPDENIHFAILSDFVDSPTEEREGEDALARHAVDAIAILNARHPAPEGRPKFALFHRARLFNPAQRCFMGWERKRGKLEELNRLLRGGEKTSFRVVTAPDGLLATIRYVITLDADTELPRAAAIKLVGTIAHPLNRPELDATRRRVISGYGIVQPRVGTVPSSSRRSVFARLSAGAPGIDPYTSAVSDVYQDLFGEGSYTGKGIYDVDAFASALDGRTPDNAVLSHDLYEGIFARTALASDIELFDEQPATYTVVSRREHRWVRGDWQLLPALLPVAARRIGLRVDDLPVLGAWKIADNLRRSLLAPSLVAAFLVACLCAPRAGGSIAMFGGLVFVAPLVVRLVADTLRSMRAPQGWTFAGLWIDTRGHLLQVALAFALFFDRAVVAVDAIARTLYRRFVTHRDLLEWQSTGLDRARRAVPSRMWIEAAALVAGAAGIAVAGGAFWVAAPVLAVWALAPALIGELGRIAAPVDPSSRLDAADHRALRRIARKTWRFFETFVTQQDNWLPPDNFQEEPRGVLAHRTSPTNIGLYLLSVVAARDFGYATTRDVVRRVNDTLNTLDRLERTEGHILNWYDTTTLKPLEPRYVSTVDSGNLAGYAWTVGHACEELLDADLVGDAALAAARDTAELAGLRPPATPGPEADLFEVAAALVAARNTVDAASTDAWTRALAHGLDRWMQEVEALAPHLFWFAQMPAGLKAHIGPIHHALRAARSVRDVAEKTPEARRLVGALEASAPDEAARAWLGELGSRLERAAAGSADLVRSLEETAERARKLGDDMRFGFLFDAERSLFAIGYNVGTARLDGSRYDLLASEARLASFVAIAKGDIPEKHWFRLGRMRCRVGSAHALLAWTGSMFEYLMPLLVMRNFESTLLGETYTAAVVAQRAHGKAKHVPWGVSEAAFNVMDLSLSYQYRAFGVQALGLKPGLDDDLVIAPYATALATMVRPDWALANFTALERVGLAGEYGFYESIDCTPSRLPPGRDGVVVKTYMAHHQGMAFVALCNAVLRSPMQRRFHADLRVRASELLLEERIPTHAVLAGSPVSRTPSTPPKAVDLAAVETTGLDAPGLARAHLLGHGELATIVTGSGTGVLTWRGLDVSRFREDGRVDPSGTFIYVRDVTHGTVWSSGFEPARAPGKAYSATFGIDRVELHRTDGAISTVTEIAVSPEHPVEVRRVTMTNHGDAPCEVEITTYTEVALAPRTADVAHRAFSNMFVETEAMPELGVLLATRRPRSGEVPPWVAQMLVAETGAWSALQYDSSRARFLGRDGNPTRPSGLGGDLPGGDGHPLDPSLVLRRKVTIEAGGTVRIALVTALAGSRADAVSLTQSHVGNAQIARTFDLAWADARVELEHLGIDAAQSFRFQRLLSALIAPRPGLRARIRPEELRGDGRAALWSQGISGDLPLLVVRIDDGEVGSLCREVLQAHEFFRLNNVVVDLLFFNEEPAGYLQPIQDQILALLRGSPAQAHQDQRGGVFVRRASHLDAREKTLVLAAGRVVLATSAGSLARQLRQPPDAAPVVAAPPPVPRGLVASAPRPGGLLFDNGTGGFAPDGQEYVVYGRPPAPWSNVLANPAFGCLVTEGGGGFTWVDNSQRRRLTPWSNDALGDPAGEMIHLRDADSGAVWRLAGTARHAHGRSVFEATRDRIRHEMTVAVSPVDPVKVTVVRLTNEGTVARRLSLFAYVEWVLGANRESARVTTSTRWDADTEAMFAENHTGMGERVAFFRATTPVAGKTADRAEYFGSIGSRARPRAVERGRLSGTTGVGLDPCGTLQVEIELQPGQSREVAFVLGAAAGDDAAKALAAEYRPHDRAARVVAEASATWSDMLSVVQVETPDRALDLLVNGWLLHQVIACRVWGRSAFYQSGGAYGFRDQLQDVLALLLARPELAREHLLRAASRQFEEGDVQHWWHPDGGDGIRTRCSDDMLWLPFAVAEYVRVTQDRGVLDEPVAFLHERALTPDDHDIFSTPRVTDARASLYEHCVRAIAVGLTSGPNGLPLMRGGDWNDGMDRVGAQGTGESVWLGWFLAKVLADFGPIAAARGDGDHARAWLREAARLKRALEDHGWDGAWYRRAYFDDGSALGSIGSAECRIDAIAQSWAVVSGAGDARRAQAAIAQSEAELVLEDPPMMRLLWPPFDGHGPDAGYIRGYPPGVRENGGQYTHGVLWTVLALAMTGEAERAHALLAKLNPVRHTLDDAGVRRYGVEPYVVAGDVYAGAEHAGRGGWTWYSGAAGWMYRIAVEHLLGLRVEGDRLRVAPCVPAAWKRYTIVYKRGATTWRIEVEPAGADHVLELDGKPVPQDFVELADDGRQHVVTARTSVRARLAV
ncbi:MAG TPA: glucoamylase family protein [Polyangiaceae bacterium]|jgi:cellobiose phosphorylase